jgi:UDP-galactopyranose mutase
MTRVTEEGSYFKMYDYLIVGAGFFGAVFAHEAAKRGKRCLMIERRDHIGGNCYTAEVEGIQVHQYGAHIFHTSDDAVWSYINQFGRFNNFVNSPIANYHGEIYNMPFNMNTFSRLWNIITPDQAKAIIDAQRADAPAEPQNLEEQAISLVGRDIYEKLVKGYTEKQWGRPCTQLPAFIIRRLPVRFTYDNNYFNDRYQGIPEEGYTAIFQRLLEGIEVWLNYDFFDHQEELRSQCRQVIFTGPIDRYFDYCYGALQYRSLRFETEVLDQDNYQGNAVVNYTDRETPYTRIIEHKHFAFGHQPKTVVTREYPMDWTLGAEPYYTVNDEENNALYHRYAALAQQEENVFFGGRLGEYKYYDMDKVIASALAFADRVLD